MPFLDWVNKTQAVKSTADVPYHLLQFHTAYGDATSENLLIQGDNLLALKALLPFYRGQVKCIYVDPPYNTQSAFEHYDDKLEHSQWLSMMYPRLVLLRELLAEDGSIWVSIDDREVHYLKVLMDEVFGRYGELQPVEKTLLADLGEFDLFTESVRLANFAVRESGTAWEIDVEGGKVRYEAADTAQLHLNDISPHTSEKELVLWLERECRQREISPTELRKWLLVLMRHLIADRGFTLTALVRAKFQLAEAIRSEIDRRQKNAMNTGFQQALPGFVAAPPRDDGFRYGFTFHPSHYPARPPFYSGRYRFKKHFYPVLHDLREKRADGQLAEEFLCARAIDLHPAVKQWVRNVEKEDRFSFWLPTATDYFYPDFVCELTDGRRLVVEYKGEPYSTNDDSREKAQVGYLWEQTSHNKSCLFLMAVAKDEQGRDVTRQIEDKIAGLQL